MTMDRAPPFLFLGGRVFGVAGWPWTSNLPAARWMAGYTLVSLGPIHMLSSRSVMMSRRLWTAVVALVYCMPVLSIAQEPEKREASATPSREELIKKLEKELT